MAKMVAQVNDELREEVQAIKAAAYTHVQEFRMPLGMPIRRSQWRLWMAEHEGEFRELMKTAPQLFGRGS